MSRNPVFTFFTAVVLTSAFAPLKAATIASTATFSLPGFSTGSLTPGLPTSPNNDNTAASSNQVSVSIFFNAGGVGPADLEFALTNSGGTTEYQVASTGLGFVNNTGSPFTGFLAELGFGTGSAFVRSGPGDDLDFDTPDRDPTPTLPAFGALTHDADVLRWSVGTVPSVGGFSLTFAVDVPDGLRAFHPGDVDRFTLRLTPLSDTAVPEPVTSGLTLMGLAAIVLVARRGQLLR